MPRHYYKTGLSHDEIIEAFDCGAYSADLETGDVFGKDGRKLKLGRCGRNKERYCVCLFWNGKTVNMPRAKLIWIVGTGAAVPPKFQIDHDDEDPTNDRFDNLLCLHPLDHRKRARQREAVPF